MKRYNSVLEMLEGLSGTATNIIESFKKMSVAKQMHALRIGSGLSIEVMAEQLGWTKKRLVFFERRDSDKMVVSDMIQYVEALGYKLSVDTDDIIHIIGNQERNSEQIKIVFDNDMPETLNLEGDKLLLWSVLINYETQTLYVSLGEWFHDSDNVNLGGYENIQQRLIDNGTVKTIYHFARNTNVTTNKLKLLLQDDDVQKTVHKCISEHKVCENLFNILDRFSRINDGNIGTAGTCITS